MLYAYTACGYNGDVAVDGEDVMLINCKACGHKARISSRNELSPTFIDLYCQCLDVNCGHTFVMSLTYSRTLRPSAGAIDQLLFDRLSQLPASQQRQLFDQLSTN